MSPEQGQLESELPLHRRVPMAKSGWLLSSSSCPLVDWPRSSESSARVAGCRTIRC